MPIFKGTYTITNLNSKTNLDLNGGNKADGTCVHGWEPLPSSATEYPNQLWEVRYTCKLGVDSYTITNKGAGTVLEIAEENGTDGTPVTCSAPAGAPPKDTAAYQEWEFVKIGTDGYYKVRNVATQNFLDIDSGSSANATKIQGWWGQLDGNKNQLWKFTEISGDA
ncbi:ricin B lectin domain-containing protein [Roridomyces roridus]|uniref:Ricin B lectin domain-containing protein n=1 Tax=Roridomyces roridus TaxID=1738132 RepID=A0AAD7CKU3_9AGAR|nr:ricin B lectin domain-containing protein [Roridomyces roridus]